MRERFEGELLRIERGVAIGWAREPAAPDARVVVEMLADGYPLASDRANVYCEEAPGDRCYGFQIRINAHALGVARTLIARIANTDAVLPGHLLLDAQQCFPQRRLEGRVACHGLRVSGVIMRTDHRVVPPEIRVMCDGEEVVRTRANRPVPLKARPSSDARALSFSVLLPIAWADSAPRTIHVVDEDGNALAGSPLTVIASPLTAVDAMRLALSSVSLPKLPQREIDTALDLLDRDDRVRLGSVALRDFDAWLALQDAQVPPPEMPIGVGKWAVLIHGNEHDDVGATLESLHQNAPEARPVLLHEDGFERGAVMQAAKSPGLLFLMRAGDMVRPCALARLGDVFEDPEVEAAYGDVIEGGDAPRPWLKPAWDPDFFLATGYALGALALRSGPWLEGLDLGAPLRCLIHRLCALETTAIRHLPELLVEAQQAPASRPSWSTQLASLAAESLNWSPEIEDTSPVRVSWPLQAYPTVRILIPTRDGLSVLEPALESLSAKTTYPDVRVTILDNESLLPETHLYFKQLKARGIDIQLTRGPFNFAQIMNEGVLAASEDVVCLLNNDVEITHGDWLEEMLRQLMRVDVGIVGAKLLWPTGIVQHAGVVLGMNGGADHIGPGSCAEDEGYFWMEAVARRVSAVTAACMVIRRSDWARLGGMDARRFPVNFNDTDLCLRMQRDLAKKVIWTPGARMLHHEAMSRGRDERPGEAARAAYELENLRQCWGDWIRDDPFYHPCLNRDGTPFNGLAFHAGPRKPRRAPT